MLPILRWDFQRQGISDIPLQEVQLPQVVFSIGEWNIHHYMYITFSGGLSKTDPIVVAIPIAVMEYPSGLMEHPSKS